MMTPELFDQKFIELKIIERRMESYGPDTPIVKVLADRKAAHIIYKQLVATLKEIDHGA